MPFVIASVNRPMSEAQKLELKARIGKAMELLPGLSESSLLLGFEENQTFYIRGDGQQKIAYIRADLFGNEAHIGFDQFGAAITAALVDILHIPPENIYIRFGDIQAWSVGGQFIERSMYQ